ncbi:FAD-binding oxidoreductase [Methylopila turkensis]|uniref:Oxidoreductase n=1 Tax=Methylopila turkensis TaxID=1437816 RepID=A0A9W6N7I0_9HYPH|nr:FAD-binding oxidoreductase [Methylopila turkensis]GLK80440.1 oxidoreductase [Methylopila turkensis]
MSAGPARVSSWREARIVAIERLTPRVSAFSLQPEGPIPFRPGQHLDVRLTAPDGYQARRSYSIASAPERPEILELAIERLDDGEVSPFFHDVAEVGDAIEIRGPIGGHFIWTVADGGPLLLIGAGSGVAPLMAMVRHRAAAGSDVPAALLLAARTRAGAPYRAELDRLADETGLALTLALSREPEPGPREVGRRVDAGVVAAALGRLPAPPSHVFVCGSNAFVNVATDALAAAGVAASVIRTERYGG